MEHGPLFYLSSWSGALALSVVVLSVVTRASFLHGTVLRKEVGREGQLMPKFHRLGGVVLACIFLFLLLSDSRLEWNPPFMTLCIGSLAIIFFSIADDFEHVAWPWHLTFQILLGLLVYSAGMRLDVQTYLGLLEAHPASLFGLLGVIAWVVLIMNAINWSDGTDGLMPGVAFLSFGTLFLLALRPEVNQPTVAILAVTLFGLSLGLLFFNWYPAKIFSGTGGAYFFGFALAVMALYAGMKVATLLLVLAVPVFDAFFVLVRRVLRGHSPFLPDKEHLHHLLLARGWRSSSVASAYLAVTGLMGFMALSLEGDEKAAVFLITGALLIAVSIMLHASLRSQLKKKHV